jgi:hypothetical protein
MNPCPARKLLLPFVIDFHFLFSFFFLQNEHGNIQIKKHQEYENRKITTLEFSRYAVLDWRFFHRVKSLENVKCMYEWKWIQI